VIGTITCQWTEKRISTISFITPIIKKQHTIMKKAATPHE